MKKHHLLFTLILSVLCLTSYAQDKKMFAGVNLGFHSNDAESHFNIGPRFGYWLSDNSAIVAAIGISNHKDKVTDIKTSGFGLGAEYRYGWHHGDNTFFYLAPGLSYNRDKEGDEDPNTDFSVFLTPGVQYMMGDRWSINAEIGLLNYTSSKVHGGDAVNQFSVGTDFDALAFTLWYHF